MKKIGTGHIILMSVTGMVIGSFLASGICNINFGIQIKDASHIWTGIGLIGSSVVLFLMALWLINKIR